MNRALPGAPRIRPAEPSDVAFIRGVAVAVFSHIGDYGTIIPEWFEHDGVSTFVAEEQGAPLGFTMLGFYRIDAPDAAPKSGSDSAYAADLLAIAVTPDAHSRGVGRRLLDHAIASARAAQKKLPVRELRLSVADTNARARRMFAAAGFVDVVGEHGWYDGGQRALHMTRPI
ncbi:MAG: N-acetyltransferase [Myxococcales bacterium]|nr:N-acetyltransferase [Myxococcales bacterium]